MSNQDNNQDDNDLANDLETSEDLSEKEIEDINKKKRVLSLFQLPEEKRKKTMDRIAGLKSSTANFTSVPIEDWCQQNAVAPNFMKNLLNRHDLPIFGQGRIAYPEHMNKVVRITTGEQEASKKKT